MTGTPKPFFIIGAPRSGTSLLRNMLRSHPLLDAPEETHFYRWSFPFKSTPYERQYRAPLLQRHRELDGVSEDDFWTLWEMAATRRELQDGYMRLFLAGRQAPAWFDKTPQNFFGALMLMADYPDSKFVHIHRDPIDVVASLVEGSVMQVRNVGEAISHWIEPIRVLAQIKRLAPDRVVELGYERLVEDPATTVSELQAGLGLPDGVQLERFEMRTRTNRNRKLLTEEDVAMIEDLCGTDKSKLGYG